MEKLSFYNFRVFTYTCLKHHIHDFSWWTLPEKNLRVYLHIECMEMRKQKIYIRCISMKLVLIFLHAIKFQ